MQPTSQFNGAADAWACAHLAGLGGWFETEGKLYWFHLELKAQDMPEDWGWPDVMQKAIGALELLGQLALVILRCRLGKCSISDSSVTIWALSDQWPKACALNFLWELP